MSFRFASEQLAGLRFDERRLAEQGAQEGREWGLFAVEDVNVARRTSPRLRITASTPHAVETPARHIHESGARAQFPFVMTGAGALPIDPQALRDDCARFLDAARAAACS
ncbi:MAG TPA: hypothetical protein VD833_16585 [Vicinamibacterales bacterium]|nr:hypothetical protein [Vicinamibacterales bacterium]